MAAGVEAEIDLYRRAAGICPSADPSRAHHLRAGGDHHGTAVVERAEPAEYPGSYRGRPKNPPRLYRDARPQAGVGALLTDPVAAAGRNRLHPRPEAGIRVRAGTS